MIRGGRFISALGVGSEYAPFKERTEVLLAIYVHILGEEWRIVVSFPPPIAYGFLILSLFLVHDLLYLFFFYQPYNNYS